MTSPTAPGQVSQPVTRLEQEVRDLRRMVEELQRKDLSNANVGQGGRLRGIYPNGAEAFMFGKDPNDASNKVRLDYSQGGPAFQVRPSQSAVAVVDETMEILDQVGNPVIQTDSNAGYGLEHPFFSYTMSGYEALDLAGNTSIGTSLEVGKNIGFAYNYARHVIARMRISNSGGATTASAFLRLTDFNNNTIADSSVQTFNLGANGVGAFTFERMVPLTEDYMATRMQTNIMAFSGAGGAVTVQAAPQMCTGIAKNWYDFYPFLH